MDSTMLKLIKSVIPVVIGILLVLSFTQKKLRFLGRGNEMHGWDETDMGWRGQYPAINGFSSIDRKAQKYPWQSPYCVANNNTVRFIDVNGEGVPIRINGIEVP